MSTYYSRKRKEREDKSSAKFEAKPSAKDNKNSNRLLAGYMACEFVAQRTLFGQKWDPARAEAAPVSIKESNKSRNKIRARAEPLAIKRKCYEEVANLLKSDGAQISGVVNPSQLVSWLQM